MIYALDSNIVSYILRREKCVRERWLHEEGCGRQSVIPLIVYYEIRRGLLSAGASVKMAGFERLCGILRTDPLTVRDMDMAADIYAIRKRLGQPIEAADLLIAAQCLSHGYTLVTNNTRHFEGISGLRLDNWVK